MGLNSKVYLFLLGDKCLFRLLQLTNNGAKL